MTQREQFEAWFEANRARYGMDEGEHGDPAWAGWQAAQSALIEAMGEPRGFTLDGMMDGFVKHVPLYALPAEFANERK